MKWLSHVCSLHMPAWVHTNVLWVNVLEELLPDLDQGIDEVQDSMEQLLTWQGPLRNMQVVG